MGQTKQGDRIGKIRVVGHDTLELFARFQRSTGFEQQAGQPVSKIVEGGTEEYGAAELLDRFVQGSRFGVRLAKGGVLIGQTGGDPPREPAFTSDIADTRRLKRLGRVLVAAHVVQHDSPMQVGLDIARVDGQRLLEFVEGAIPLPEESEGQTQELMDVGEPASLRQELFQEVDRAVVVLDRKTFPRLQQQVVWADVHKYKITRLLAAQDLPEILDGLDQAVPQRNQGRPPQQRACHGDVGLPHLGIILGQRAEFDG